MVTYSKIRSGMERDFRSFIISAERLAHPPLGARASVERGVEVGIIIKAGKQSGS